MKASETNLIQFLSKPDTQFVIPIYQRTYSWTREQCQQLWNDIYRVAHDDKTPAHFVGSVVYIQEGVYHASSTQQMLVIDGQQRLTTVLLLLVALARALKDNDALNVSHDQIFDQFLTNKYAKGDLRYKLILTQSDKSSLIQLLKGQDLPAAPSLRIKENFEFFEGQIRKSGGDLDTLFNGIKKLLIVDVSLDANHDNPQLIFESLNSTGLALSQADLIRNYVLMGLPAQEQNDLYEQYWYPMEQRFGHSQYAELFDRFMRDYLTIQSESGTIPNIRDVYTDFKKFTRGKDVREVVKSIAHYARYFAYLAFPQSYNDKQLQEVMRYINTLKVDVAYPFLIEVFDDYERHQRLSRADFLEILRLVESYVFRRAIVEIPTNSMNKTFATFKRAIDKTDYLNSVKEALIKLDGYRRFPADREFRQAFMTRNIYTGLTPPRRSYLFNRLENHNHKEYIDTDKYTIEHIMPQNPNLSTEWQMMLGSQWREVQEYYLHTIGNLTLTGYNAELSDRPFAEKRDMKGGFADSHLRLNKKLAQLNKWDENAIKERAETLAKMALQIWPYPKHEKSED
ncbi:MAG: DUF262 domain-containing protein [Anaerolineae bacterium]|jgi:uncharacterized protein with ParB-like and HNH nuclease domain|nr:DUF262 domain-containing protein [Anaerolineae bacterium]